LLPQIILGTAYGNGFSTSAVSSVKSPRFAKSQLDSDSIVQAISRRPVAIVVQQHAEESAILRNTRSVLTSAPHVKLHQLRRLDDRIAAHLDGVAVAGDFGWKLCEAGLEDPSKGTVFAATERAIEDKNLPALNKLLALAEALPEAQPGLISAFGWASAQFLQGTIKSLLAASNPFQRQVGIAACVMHQVDPGAALAAAVVDADASLRARALRVAGETGRRDLLPACIKALADKDTPCQFWAAYATALLGEQGKAKDVLQTFVARPGPFRVRALQLLLKFIAVPQANELLKGLARDPANIRLLIQGACIAGDPYYVPWLIKQMADLKLTRLAGESFTFITGLDLSYLDLDRKPPENVEFGPNDNPDDPDVAMDEDDSLPWPDPVKIQAWWDANKSRFTDGTRYFMSEPVTRAHCVQVLKEGYQRQRMAAALYLCLLQPGTKLFPTKAPAWRQQRWLAALE
jgi:uncharacterized protein (TIGR02270 family)